MAYDRWGMTSDKASTLTGVTVDDDALEVAEDEIREELGWSPRPDAYSSVVDDAGTPWDRRVWAFGRAVAWQAAYRAGTPATADDQAVRISSESIGSGDYAATYAAGGAVEGGPLAPRARRLLASNGWLSRRLAGHTRP